MTADKNTHAESAPDELDPTLKKALEFDEKLQRFYDDELSDAERTIVLREVEATEEHQLRLDQMSRLGDLLRFSANELNADVSSEQADDLFATISENLVNTNVVRLDAARAERKRHTGYVVGAFAIAAAFALFMMFRGGDGTEVAQGDDATVTDETSAPVVTIEDEPVVEIHAAAGSEVEEVDFGANTGTVFEVEGAAGQPLAVVWIVDSEEEVL